MASLDSSIEIKQELRPCFVNDRKALFHKWVHNKDMINIQQEYEMGIVEYEDGHIDTVYPKQIKFCDEKINEVCKLKTELYGNSISKDKIKEKIESLEEKIHIVIPNEYNKIEVMNEFKNEGAIDVLKELLEEE